ncbi:acyl carrier protein [Streptomyces sp. NPDC090306]|uniref:acyl carrier protein n=1 Tax=Streptomyces sp. NPDC090306 TaxID=3365961 RepID=UPI003821C1E2
MLTDDFGVAPHRIEPDALLHELSLHCVAVDELRLLAEELFGLDLDRTAITPRDTVGTLVRVIGAGVAGNASAGPPTRPERPARPVRAGRSVGSAWWMRWALRVRRMRDSVARRVSCRRGRTRAAGPEGT